MRIAPVSADAAWDKFVERFERGKIKEREFWKEFLDFLGMRFSGEEMHKVVIKQFKPIKKTIALLKN